MKRILAALLAISLAFLLIIGFEHEQVQDYPSEWPDLTGMSESCLEIQGSFTDTNRMRWEHEEFRGVPQGAKHGGVLEAAWNEFGFSENDVLPGNKKIMRRFNTHYGTDGIMNIDYSLDGNLVASKHFPKDVLRCTKDGLEVMVNDRSGVIFDKIPNNGRIVHHAVIYRHNSHLYVKSITEAQARLFHVVPISSLRIVWFRFPESVL